MNLSENSALANPASPDSSIGTSGLHTMLAGTEYDQRVADYARRIHRSVDISATAGILHQALREAPSSISDSAARAVSAAAREIAALKSELERLRSGSVHLDCLTGVLNRSGLDRVFAREAARADRSHVPLGIALIDVDDFKAVNDVHGHPAGDAALLHIVRTLQTTLRPTDALVRFGGDELLVVLPAADRLQPMAALNRVQRELTLNPLIYAQRELALNFSAGVTVREYGETLEQVVARVDAGLYSAKRAGKRKVILVN